MDLDYVEALEYGLPPTGWMGMGIDRHVMLLTCQESIQEVILFHKWSHVINSDKINMILIFKEFFDWPSNTGRKIWFRNIQ